MHDNCPDCKLKYERAPGYFLGSTYINYVVTAILLTATYVTLHFGVGYSNQWLAGPLVAFCVLFPLGFFRYARALWLAIDCYFDASIFEQKDD